MRHGRRNFLPNQSWVQLQGTALHPFAWAPYPLSWKAPTAEQRMKGKWKMGNLRTCSVEELRTKIEDGDVSLVDVREYPEYAAANIEGATLVPLGTLRKNPNLVSKAGEVYLICRSGRRAEEAARLLCECGSAEPIVVVGGIEAWKEAGYPVKTEKGPIALERQVRIAAGALVLTGLFVPGLRYLPYIVGAGLVFAGVSNTCAMGMVLARFPWNRRPTTAIDGAACSAGH